MSVTFDATANYSNLAASAPNWAHTVGTGTDRFLIVGFSVSNTVIPTSVAYGGVSMTLITSLVEGTGTTARSVALFYLLNPTSGTANITATASGMPAVVGGSISFSGVSQTVPLGTAVTNGGTSTNSLSATTTGSTANDVVVAVMTARDSIAITIGGSQTSRWALFANTNVAGVGTTQTGGSSITSTFSWTTPDNGAMIAVPILNDSNVTPSITYIPYIPPFLS